MHKKKRDWGDVYDKMVKQLKQNSEFYVDEGKKKKKKKKDYDTGNPKPPNAYGRWVGGWDTWANGNDGDSGGGVGGDGGGGGGE